MLQQKKWLLIGVIAIVVFGIFVGSPIQLIFDSLDIYGQAPGRLSRAEAAQTANEVIEHVQAAQKMLPRNGAIAWWSPEKGDFESLQTELDNIVVRARSLSGLTIADETFVSVMFDIHSKLEDIQHRLVVF